MNLFGKNLFDFKKHTDKLLRKNPGKMYDFAQHGLLNSSRSFDLLAYNDFAVEAVTPGTDQETAYKTRKKKEAEEIAKTTITPKDLFKTKALNDHDFAIKTGEDYLVAQITVAKEKLALLGQAPKRKKDNGLVPYFEGESGMVKYGRMELESIIERLENRRKIKDFKKVLEEYPHTTSKLLNEVVLAHKNLRCEEYSQFVPDLPKTATDAVKAYNDMCIALCGKKGNFYIIADKKDFEKVPARRDPILVAQSPFGFFWQILGAWDDEMIYLGDL